MKKTFIFFGLIFLTSLIFGQKISSLEPTMIIWKSNNNKVSLADGRYGIMLEDSLSLDVYFSQQTYDRFKEKNVTFEFRWYYYLSTRKSLMYVDKVNSFRHLGDGSMFVHSAQNKLQPGWWEVQILTSFDNGLLEIANTSKFQVMIKK